MTRRAIDKKTVVGQRVVMTSVTVSAQSGDSEIVTNETFRSWKRRNGRNAAFVIQTPEHFVGTYADMNKLPAGEYRAELVRKCAFPDSIKKSMRGTDLWKCV